MTTLVQRSLRVRVAEVVPDDFGAVSTVVRDLSKMRVQFRVERTLKKQPNSAQVQVWNLAGETRDELSRASAKVLVDGGYGDDLRRLFVGDVHFATSFSQGAEWVTKMEAKDGGRAFKFARTSFGLSPGARYVDALHAAGRDMGLDTGNLETASAAAALRTKRFHAGFAAHGLASKELDKLLKAVGMEWSVQDGTLQVLSPGQATQEIVNLGPEVGLVGSPELGAGEGKKARPTLKVKCLLQGRIVPGCQVHVSSRHVEGTFRCKTVVHTGDTAGGDWYTEADLEVLA